MTKSPKYRIFLQPPPEFKPTMEAAGCYCASGNTLLLVKRQSFKTQANKWGLPAGKLEKHETPVDAVIRELKEEVGVHLHASQLHSVRKLYIHLPPIDYIFHMFYAEFAERPQIVLDEKENQEAGWKTLEEALHLPLMAAGTETLLYYKSFLSHKTK